MKASLKIILTILLAIATIMSLCSMLFTGFSVIGGIIRIAFSLKSNFAYLIAGILSGLASVGLGIALMILFLIIAIACVIGIIYVFIDSSDKKIKELEAVISAAYSDNTESNNTSEPHTTSDEINIEPRIVQDSESKQEVPLE